MVENGMIPKTVSKRLMDD